MRTIEIKSLISNIDELQSMIHSIEKEKKDRNGDQYRLMTIDEYVDQALLYARNLKI